MCVPALFPFKTSPAGKEEGSQWPKTETVGDSRGDDATSHEAYLNLEIKKKRLSPSSPQKYSPPHKNIVRNRGEGDGKSCRRIEKARPSKGKGSPA